MDLNDLTKNAIVSSMAQDILQKISAEHRNAILEKSIESALKSYDFHRALEKVVAAKVEEVAAAMLQTPEWTGRIEKAVRQGMDHYIAELAGAMKDTLVEAMHGKSGDTYGRKTGIILDYIEASRPESE